MTRRTALTIAAGFAVSAAGKTPVINAAEHAWVIHDRRFAPDAEVATCPTSLPNYEYSGEFLVSEMKTYSVDGVVISHVCYLRPRQLLYEPLHQAVSREVCRHRTPGRLSPPLSRRQGESRAS